MSDLMQTSPTKIKYCRDCNGTVFRLFEIGGHHFLCCVTCQNAPGQVRCGVFKWAPELHALPTTGLTPRLETVLRAKLRLYLSLLPEITI